jgi:hypothetical protein
MLAEPPPDLQEAFRQLNGTSVEKRGSGVIIHRSFGAPVYLGKDILFRLGVHQGNPEAVAEIIAEATRPKDPPKPKKKRALKPGGSKRI